MASFPSSPGGDFLRAAAAATAAEAVAAEGNPPGDAELLKAAEYVATQLFGVGGFTLFPSTCESGVPDQPMSADDCLGGAANRARASRVAGGAEHDYGVGMEGGLEQVGSGE